MSDAPRFLDTNVLLRYLTRDDETKAEQALALLQRVEQDTERVALAPHVVAELVFTLDRFYKTPRTLIRELVRDIITLPGVQLPGRALLLDALDLFASNRRKISFADAYTTIYMRSRGLTELYSWDTDFDAITGVSRVEPS
jgi:predicted nucleic acid-binding protein